VLFTCLGLPLARRVNLAGVPPLSVAPALGWAVFSVLALPVFSLTGFSTAAVTLYAAVLIAAAYGLHRRGRTQLPAPMAKIFPLWAMGLAAAMGVLPIAAVMPKFVAPPGSSVLSLKPPS